MDDVSSIVMHTSSSTKQTPSAPIVRHGFISTYIGSFPTDNIQHAVTTLKIAEISAIRNNTLAFLHTKNENYLNAISKICISRLLTLCIVGHNAREMKV